MKVQLKSDFRDWYDHWFDLTGVVYERMSRTNLHRLDAFKILTAAGYQVPEHGTVRELRSNKVPLKQVVVYVDPYAHRGVGKYLEEFTDDLPPDAFCAEFIRNTFDEIPATSIRWLWVGDMKAVIRYTSDHEWQSNVGDVTTTVLKVWHNTVRDRVLDKWPMVAIDFTKDRAVDLNTAPGLDVLRDVVEGKYLYERIKEHIARRAG